MTRLRFSLASLLVFVSFASTALAADPEFKVGLVTDSRDYEREQASASIAGVPLPPKKQWTARVTVALDGERITGEWAPASTLSASAKDFPRGSDVQTAVKRNQLLLKRPDGSVVTAKIVSRVKQPQKDERG